MQNPLLAMMMNQLKVRNPQLFRVVEQAQQNQNNPMDLLKQITSNYTPEQMSGLLDRAKQMGVPEDVLKQVQNNGINTK